MFWAAGRLILMAELWLDLVCLYTSPAIIDPEEALFLRLLEWLIKWKVMPQDTHGLKISLPRLRFLSSSQLEYFFKSLEDACSLVGISSSDVNLVYEQADLKDAHPLPRIGRESFETIYAKASGSDFENEILEVFMPLINYGELYRLYGIDNSVTNILIHGHNSGNSFIRWFKRLQKMVNGDNDGINSRKILELSVIRIEEVLSPYFGESEQNIKLLFESAIANAPECVLCICLEGVQYFRLARETMGALERRMLATILLLLDGITKPNPIKETITSKNGDYHQDRLSIVVVATSEDPPELLDEALTRPGRLDKIIPMKSPI